MAPTQAFKTVQDGTELFLSSRDHIIGIEPAVIGFALACIIIGAALILMGRTR